MLLEIDAQIKKPQNLDWPIKQDAGDAISNAAPIHGILDELRENLPHAACSLYSHPGFGGFRRRQTRRGG
jgi:hypothetical protein